MHILTEKCLCIHAERIPMFLRVGSRKRFGSILYLAMLGLIGSGKIVEIRK